MKFALVDLQFETKKANRDHTGGFGSFMHAPGFFGKIISALKSRLIELPLTHFGYSTAILKRAGHEVHHYTGGTQGEDIIIIASSMHCYADEVAFAKAQKALFPKSKIGFFGAFMTTNPQYFQDAADFMIYGEMETALFAFLDGKHSFDGKLDYGIVHDMASLPTPDWEGTDISKLSYFPLLHKRPFVTLQASRGCSYNCDFCPYMVIQGKIYRRRPPENIVAEMETLIERHGIRSFLFRDICFTLNKKYAEDIARLMIKRNVNLEWACETRVDCLTKGLVDIMYDAGMRGVNLGIETGSLEILKESGKKPTELEFQDEMIAYMQKKGIRLNAFYMLGLKGDTPKTMQETRDYAAHLNTLGAQFCTMTPFPGTPLFEDVKDKLITKDFTRYNEYEPVVDIGTSTPAEVQNAAAQAYRYYLRPSWMLKFGFQTVFRLLVNLLVNLPQKRRRPLDPPHNPEPSMSL